MKAKKIEIQVSYKQRRLYSGEKHLLKYVTECINDFQKLDNKLFFTCDFDKKIKSIINIKFNKNNAVDNIKGELIFTTEFNYQFMQHEEKEFSNQKEYEDYALIVMGYNYFDYVQQVIIMSYISYPGGFELTDRELKVNNEIINVIDTASFITDNRLVLDYVKEIGWPKFKNISTSDVLCWLQKNKFDFSSISKTKAERAINALSHIFRKSNNAITSFDLFWALLGVEAIYCTSKEGLTNQIFERTQIVLGEMKDYKKRLKEMYDFRSRLIHGDIDIPSIFSEEFLLGGDKTFHDRLFNATNLAKAILICTLQEMIIRDINEFKFETIIK